MNEWIEKCGAAEVRWRDMRAVGFGVIGWVLGVSGHRGVEVWCLVEDGCGKAYLRVILSA